jgi:hypothetical protein
MRRLAIMANAGDPATCWKWARLGLRPSRIPASPLRGAPDVNASRLGLPGGTQILT